LENEKNNLSLNHDDDNDNGEKISIFSKIGKIFAREEENNKQKNKENAYDKVNDNDKVNEEKKIKISAKEKKENEEDDKEKNGTLNIGNLNGKEIQILKSFKSLKNDFEKINIFEEKKKLNEI
jgi:hypothetical protein